jgi:hypothetical protein
MVLTGILTKLIIIVIIIIVIINLERTP